MNPKKFLGFTDHSMSKEGSDCWNIQIQLFVVRRTGAGTALIPVNSAAAAITPTDDAESKRSHVASSDGSKGGDDAWWAAKVKVDVSDVIIVLRCP